MTRLRVGFALTVLAICAGNVAAAPLEAPQADVIERLAPAFATGDPARLSMAYRAMGDYGQPAAKIVETSVNAAGYRHFHEGNIEAAIRVFELNTRTFPESANAWDSLAEATLANGDNETAYLYYRRSLELDPDNGNAAKMIAQMIGSQLYHASGNKG